MYIVCIKADWYKVISLKMLTIDIKKIKLIGLKVDGWTQVYYMIWKTCDCESEHHRIVSPIS